jgi:hypothetical protein
MICKLLVLLLPLLLGLLASAVPGRQASGWAASWPAGCPAAPPDSGRYASVRGTVRLARTNRPLAGVLLAIEYFGAWDFRFTGDSVRTDAQGRYVLRFHPEEGRGYAVLFDPAMGRRGNQPSRYVFRTSSGLVSAEDRPDRRFIKSDTVTVANFAPDFAPNYSRPIDLHLPAVGH